MALLERPALFSALPGMERLLMVLDPIVIELAIRDDRRTLRQRDVMAFRGDDPVALVALDRPGRVLNLMGRADRWLPSIDRSVGAPFGWIVAPGGDLVLGQRPAASAIEIHFADVEKSLNIGEGGYGMSHLSENTDALVQRIHRIIGQLQAIERGVLADADCAKTLHLTAAVRGAVGGLMDELIEAHVRAHVADHGLTPDERDEGAEALILAIRRYAK